MKRSNLWTGVGMVAAGILFLLAALLWDTPVTSLFCGFSGAFVVPGAVQILKYVKWTRPQNISAWQERLEQEQIDLRDERKSMIRDKSGRYAYIFGVLTLAVAELVFWVLERLGTIGESEGRLIVLFLAGNLLVQYLAGLVFYRLLERKF